jgi:DNA-binding transcriptional ArsR family regulator
MEQDNMDTLLQFFKVLANENRLKLIGILARGEHGVEELATLLNLKASTVSHHLSKLKELDLLSMRTEGNDHLYRLDVSSLEGMTKEVMSSFKPESVPALVNDLRYDHWERKVLNTYVEGDKIQAIPMGYKKRLVVLKWVADHFEFGQSYSEAEVNDLISHHNEDYCTLRREMIEEGMMQREGHTYQRLDWEMPNLSG